MWSVLPVNPNGYIAFKNFMLRKQFIDLAFVKLVQCMLFEKPTMFLFKIGSQKLGDSIQGFNSKMMLGQDVQNFRIGINILNGLSQSRNVQGILMHKLS